MRVPLYEGSALSRSSDLHEHKWMELPNMNAYEGTGQTREQSPTYQLLVLTWVESGMWNMKLPNVRE